LGLLVEYLENLIQEFKPQRVVVERAIYVHNIRTALALGQARGALVGIAARQGLTVDEVGPMQVKQAVTGRGRSSKAEVAEMVRRLLGLPEVAQEDASDALALAITLALGPSEGPTKKPKKGRKAWEELAKKRGLI
jgi:crossover junction endodeoxyribonuclease RuvC